MKISKYNYEDEDCPTLPHLDLILQKFDKVVVVTDVDAKVIGYAGYVVDGSRCDINSFWAKGKSKEIFATLIKALKGELNFATQKRMGVIIEDGDTKLIDLFNANDWYVWVPDALKDISPPARACFMLNIPPATIDALRLIDAEYRTATPRKKQK